MAIARVCVGHVVEQDGFDCTLAVGLAVHNFLLHRH